MLTGDASAVFLVSITGELVGGTFPDHDSVYGRLCWVYGQDWAVTAGQVGHFLTHLYII